MIAPLTALRRWLRRQGFTAAADAPLIASVRGLRLEAAAWQRTRAALARQHEAEMLARPRRRAPGPQPLLRPLPPEERRRGTVVEAVEA